MEEKGEGRRVTVQRKEGGMIEMGWSGVGEEGWIAGEWDKHIVETAVRRGVTHVYVCTCIVWTTPIHA